jgi:methionyl aminopeptidase
LNIHIKTPEEIEKMRVAGRLASEVLDMIAPYVKAGISTDEINTICHNYITKVQDAIPAPLNYRGFPKSICTSINQQICHGIPGNRILKNGDIIGIDITVIKDGYHGDTTRTFSVGRPGILAERLIKVTKECLDAGIKQVFPGKPISNIGVAIQKHAELHRFSVVREYCGHGLGLIFHEPPTVLHYASKSIDVTMLPGMTFTIEPMINSGERHSKVLADGWTVVTKDHSLSAQFEHTILVTEIGYEVLTLGNGEHI